MSDEVHRLRPARFIQSDSILRPYIFREADGNQILQASCYETSSVFIKHQRNTETYQLISVAISIRCSYILFYFYFYYFYILVILSYITKCCYYWLMYLLVECLTVFRMLIKGSMQLMSTLDTSTCRVTPEMFCLEQTSKIRWLNLTSSIYSIPKFKDLLRNIFTGKW